MTFWRVLEHGYIERVWLELPLMLFGDSKWHSYQGSRVKYQTNYPVGTILTGEIPDLTLHEGVQ